MKLADLPLDEQTYLRDCSRTGAYVDPQRLSAQLRERVEAQVLRQRPIVNGKEHYYMADVIAEIERPIGGDLITTADYLRAYSEGRITRDVAMDGIGVDNYRDFSAVLLDGGYRLPRGTAEQTDAEVAAALPILRRHLKDLK
jgi:hypothetical protein